MLLALLIGSTVGAVTTAHATSGAQTSEGWKDQRIAFNVLRKGDKIGEHIITINPTEHGFDVRVDLALAVKFGPITVYKYTHKSQKQWRQGRLYSIETTTDENGKKYRVSGVLGEEGFKLSGSKGEIFLPDDVLTSTYWQKRTVINNEMLDSQKGELFAYDVSEPEYDSSLRAHKYKITGALNVDLWYRGDEFIKMVFHNDGNLVEYELMEE